MDQALPTGFDNTAGVWENMPIYAAMQTGQQNAIANENNAALQRAYQGEQDFNAQKRPVELSNLMATGDHTHAQTGLLGSQTDAADLANQGTRATQPGAIAATNAKNSLSKMEDEGQLFGQIATRIGDPKMPAFERARIVKEMLGDSLPNHPEIDMGLIRNADNLPKMFAQMSEQSRQQTTKYKDEQDKLKNARDVASIGPAAQVKIAQMNIDAGKFNAKNRAGAVSFEQDIFKLKKASEKFAALNDAAKAAEQAGNDALSIAYRARAEELRPQAMAELSNAGAPTVVQQPGQRPQLVNKAGQVELGGGNKPKLGTAENPIKLD